MNLFLKKYILAFLLAVLATASARADQSQSEEVVVGYLASQVRQTSGINLYHWGRIKNFTNPSSNDAKIASSVKIQIDQYWPKFLTAANGQLIGDGYYVSVDPVATRNYGGIGNDWALTQISVSGNFTIYDTNGSSNALPADVSAAFSQIGCGGAPQNRAQDIFQNASKSCLKFLAHVFSERLKVDAFSYMFTASHLACEKNPEFGDAMILASSAKIPIENIKVFGAQTKDDVQERARIQAMYFIAALDEWKLDPSSPVPPVYPTNFSASPAPPPSRWMPDHYVSQLLWSDLDGVATPKDIRSWMQSKLYECKK